MKKSGAPSCIQPHPQDGCFKTKGTGAWVSLQLLSHEAGAAPGKAAEQASIRLINRAAIQREVNNCPCTKLGNTWVICLRRERPTKFTPKLFPEVLILFKDTWLCRAPPDEDWASVPSTLLMVMPSVTPVPGDPAPLLASIGTRHT